MTGDYVAPSERATVHSHPERARYDFGTAAAVLDDGRMGYLATVFDGEPHLVPMMYLRQGEYVHLHGRKGTRLMNHLNGGASLAFSVTLIEGLVLARDVRYNSLNYRSVVIYGSATEIAEVDAKRSSFIALAERHWPGRMDVLPPTLEQLDSVTLLALPLDEFSAKVRTGPPAKASPDADQRVWAGHVDLRTEPFAFHPDTFTPEDISSPSWPFSQSTQEDRRESS